MSPNNPKADYELEVTLQNQGGKQVAVLQGLPPFFELHKTVIYRTNVPDAEAYVEFKPHSPYDNPNKTEKLDVDSKDKPLELVRKGDFPANCYLIMKVKDPLGKMVDTKIGYGNGGGNHVVR